jgi:copper chaperone CopZ
MKNFICLAATVLTLLPTPSYAAGKTIYADVNGLVCDFCARALEKVFAQQSAVENINVNLDTKVVTINLRENQTLEDDIIKKLINDSGYDVTGIRHENKDETP